MWLVQTLGFAQQPGANLQWLPHPAVLAPSVQPTAAEISSPSAAAAPKNQSGLSPLGKHPSAFPMASPPTMVPPEALSPPAPLPKVMPRNPFGDALRELSPQAGGEVPLPKVSEPPYLPEEETRPLPGHRPEELPTTPRPTQVRAECVTDANLLLPIHKLNTRLDIDPNVHPEITSEEEDRLRRAGQPTRLELLTRAKAEFDAKMWCDPPTTPLPERMTKAWPKTTMSWKASALCHKPLYFEQAHLERYGHSTGPLTQPIISAGHFYLMIPTLPYQLALWPPYECIYPLGHYRPGSCAPYYLDPIPISIRAALAEAGAWVGGVFLVP
ncbi:MAG: hypothetical protein NZ602_04080 [Thermoguttaceae bacterium]|nr:hypothetical protein [Thermoguttaceae bacterium]MDW8038230.1 hypothetical protein [Thermoguttaceae bacterium]